MYKLYLIFLLISTANKLFSQSISEDSVTILSGWKNKGIVNAYKPRVEFKKNKVIITKIQSLTDETFSKDKDRIIRVQDITIQTVYTKDTVFSTENITSLTYFLIKKDIYKEAFILGKNKYRDVIEIEKYDKHMGIPRTLNMNEVYIKDTLSNKQASNSEVKQDSSVKKSDKDTVSNTQATNNKPTKDSTINKSEKNIVSNKQASNSEEKKNSMVKKKEGNNDKIVENTEQKKDTNRVRKIKEEKKNIVDNVQIKFDKIPTSHTRSQLHQLYRKNKSYKLFYLEVSITPAFSNRSVFINNPQFDNNQSLVDRQQNETAIWMPVNIEAAIGWNFKPSHSIYAGFLHLRQGFQATNHAVDWENGLSVPNNNLNLYRFRSNGFGLGYRYREYQKIHSFAFDAGLYTTWVNSTAKGYTDPNGSSNNKKNELAERNIRSTIFGAKVGIGYRWAMGYNADLCIMPTLFYNFTPSSRSTELNTNLWNIGITVGLRGFL